MLTVRIQEKNYSESIMVLKLKDGEMLRFWKFPAGRAFFVGHSSTCHQFETYKKSQFSTGNLIMDVI